MKKKIIFSIFILTLFLSFLIPNQTFATNSNENYDAGYTIESYDINMIVNENNSFDITETINANFTGYGKHGIIRNIPLRNTVIRSDLTVSSNKAKISNISVNDSYTTSLENGGKILKIGDKDQTVSGRKTYVIKYNYNIGKDPLKDKDELYFNLIGSEWDTSIDNVTFSITMPKSFDESKLGFSSGNIFSADSSNVNYSVTGNTISGSLKTKLSPAQAFTVRLTLPEGYFVVTDNFDVLMLIEIIISILFVIISFILWRKNGKQETVVETVEFYPPHGINSVDLGFIYKGRSEEKDIISLLIYLANKGYLKIEEIKEKKFKLIKTNDFKIIKVKEYDGDNEDERTFFNDLFSSKDEVTRNDLYDKFYLTLRKISGNINRKENREKIFEKGSLTKRRLLIVMVTVVSLFCGITSIIREDIEMGYLGSGTVICIFSLSFLVSAIVSIMQSTIKRSLVFIILFYLCCIVQNIFADMFLSDAFLIKFIIESACLAILFIFLFIMKKRTKYGAEMLGKIRGFKTFLETAEKPKLEELVMKDSEYFYNILPYTYVLGVSKKWMKKFENIAMEAPRWYYGSTSFNNYSFARFMDQTYSAFSKASSSSESGSSSGGGFSGGGSGGGGGSSW